jgi:transcriptional regulator with XRE-family HTH domain
MKETLGQRLKRLREAAGLTQAALADAAGVPIGTIRGYEYDRREPLVGTVVKIARAIGVSLDELAGLNDDATPPGRPARKGRGKK